MKCPSCKAVIDQSYVDSFGSARSVSCPACGFMLEVGSTDLMSTASEFQAVSGWTIRLAKGQEVHFDSQAAFSAWLKKTTVTPGDLISKDGRTWENLGNFLLGSWSASTDETENNISTGYTVPPNTLDAPDPEDEFEELQNAMDAADVSATPSEQILKTAVGRERRTPPPLPGRATAAFEPAPTQQTLEEPVVDEPDETLHLDAVTPEELKKASESSVSSHDGDGAEPSNETAAVSGTISPAAEFQPSRPQIQEHSKNASSVATTPSQPSPSGRSGLGMVVFGVLLGAVIGVVGDRIYSEGEPASGAIQVVQSASKPLDLQTRELLETANRWVSYFELQTVTTAQLQSRLTAGQETTERAQNLREALISSAYLLDLKRHGSEAAQKPFIALYTQHFALTKKSPFGEASRFISASKSKSESSPKSQKSTTVVSSAPKLAAAPAAKPLEEKKKKAVAASVETSAPSTEPKSKKKVKKAKDAKRIAKSAAAKRDEKAKAKAKKQKDAKKVKGSYKKLLKRGQSALQNGRSLQAKKALSEAVKVNPSGHRARMLLGYVELNQGNLRGALNSFQLANKLNSADRQTLLGLGSVYEKLGRRSQARKIYQRYQRLFTGPSDRRKIEFRLDRVGK